MNSPRLSIIIPFYNVEAYIEQCLDSVFKQDIPEEQYEVICVDDCSPDRSLSIVEEFAQKHTNLVIVRNQINRKLGGARNAGLEIAQGKYIWFIDSDDLIEENVLGTLCQAAEAEDLDVLHFDYENYPVRSPLFQIPFNETMNGPDMFFDTRLRWAHELVTAWRKLYKRSFLIENNISFAEHIMFEDNDYAILVFAYAKRVKHIHMHAYNYRQNPDSITRMGISSKHISYWMDLCHRLVAIKKRFMDDGRDARFQPVLEQFIKYQLSYVKMQYEKLDKNEKKKARKEIIRQTDISLRPFLSRKSYLMIKLGLI